MRKIFTLRKTLLVCLIAIGAMASAQTNPSPQPLPYSQNFGSFNGSTTVYPAGIQGWTVPGSLGASYATAAPSGDQALTAMTNATTSGAVGDINGKIGLLSTSSALKAICVAVVTTNFTNITVSYTAATQRQQVANRIDELGLQYRVGTTGTFTNVAGAVYSNPGGDNLTGTASVSPATINVTLPSACDNQLVVQLRWVMRDVSGSGNRPSFSVDDISVGGTSTTPVTSSLSPSSIAAGGSGFNLTVNGSNFINGSTVTWNGSNRTTTFVSASQLIAAIPASDIASPGTASVGVTTPGAPAVSNTQTFTINAAATPSLVVSSPPAAFGSQCLNTSTIHSFTIDGSNLDGSSITVASLPGFSYAATSGGTYTSSLSLSYTGGGFTGKTVYVKFTPTAVQSYDGNIILSGGGISNFAVPVSGSGINTPPTITTGSSVVGGTSASLFGTLAASACETVNSYGFEYSTTSGFATGTGTQVTSVNLNSGAFSKTVSSLTGATTYYYRAYATTASGTFYGNENNFTTSSVVPVVMSAQPLLRYTENFGDIGNWGANFTSGTGANHFASVGVAGSATIPNPTRTTTSTAAFSSGTSGGVQKGSGSLLLLSTGSTDNSSSAAVDFYMDFTGVNAGTLSFDWATVNNSTGDRNGSLRVYGSTDGITFTEITSADVLNFTNNVPSTGTVTTVQLPSSFNGSPTARLRFYYHNGSGGSAGSRPKISIDNLTVTAIPSSPCETPSAGPSALTFGTITETSVQGSFTAASPAVNEYLVVMSENSSLTSSPIDGQTYVIGDNVGDGTVIAKGSELNFTATDLTGSTTYYFFIFPVNSVCTGGPKYLTANPLSDDATTQAGLPACAAPAAQPAGLALTSSINSVHGSFTATAADEYIVLQSTDASFTGTLVNGTTYNAGATVGNATVVQRSNATSFTAGGLNPQTQYYYYIFSVNSQACVNGPVYNMASPLTGSATTLPLPACTTPVAQPSDLAFNASNNSITATFNAAGSNLNYLVVMSTSSSLTAGPADNTDYAAGASLGGGTVISNSTGTSFIATGLNAASTYYFFVFAANKNCTGGTKYLATSPLAGSATTTNAPVNNYYFGNLHSHSDYSDGNKDHPGYTPADDYNYALGSMGMDFLGISEHNHFSSVDNPGNEIANYHMGSAQAAAFNATHSNFLALYGMEWGVISGGGHVVVYGDNMNDLFGWESNVNGHTGPNYDVYVPKSTYIGSEGLFKTVNDYVSKNTFATLAHPNNTDFNNLANIDYDPVADAAITGVAVESGPATSSNVTYSNPASPMYYLWYFQKLLAKGYHLGPTIDHDNHNTTFGRTTTARLGVIAPALTQSDIIKAVRDMHFYATEDIDARVDFTINTRIMGSVFEDRNAPSIAVNLTDPSTSTSNALIRVMFGIPGSGTTAVVIDSVFGSSLSYVDNALANHATGYYYIDITNQGKRIITSPIWYTRTCAATSDTTANVCGSFNWYGTVYTSSATLTKTFVSSGGCDSVVTLHLTVSNPPASASISLAGPSAGCPGTGVALTASANDGGNGAIASYLWSKDGSVVATTGTGAYTATQSGAYTVSAVNAGGCSVTGTAAVSVTVEDDAAPVPDVATLPVITGECSVTVPGAPTATDACAGSITGTTTDPLSYSALGTHTIHWSFDDGHGNISSQDQTVQVVDTQAPVIAPMGDITVSNDPGKCSAAVNFTASASDNCSGVSLSYSKAPGSDFAVGTTAVTVTATDAAGNSSVATFNVIVNDTEKPSVTAPMAISVVNDHGRCGATIANIGTAAASDNCGVASVTNNHPADNYYPVGTTIVTWTVTDVHGNVTDTATQAITVIDNELPVISVTNISVPNTAGQCGANITLAAPVTSDNCGVASVSSDHPSDFFPTGVTNVKWAVTDNAGWTAYATQVVTVTDAESPVVHTQPVTIYLDASGNATLTAAQVNNNSTDNCSIASYSLNKTSFNCSGLGANNVVLTVTDASGNYATASAVVTVKDAIAPVAIAQPVTVYLGASGTASVSAAQVNNGSSDNCGIVSYSLSQYNFNCGNLGANAVTLTVTDASGNSSSVATTVTVKDNTAPVAVAQPVTLYLDASGQATLTAAQVNNGSADNCGVSGYTVSKTSFNCANLGTNAVTLTVTDASGNSSSASTTITVKDNTAPVAVAHPVTLYLDASGQAALTAAQVNNGSSDNCGITGYTVSKTSFNCANLGANAVTLTVTDASGNSSSVSTTVTVKDNTAPVAVAQPVTLYLDASGQATLTAAQVNNGSSDNCGISGYTVSKTSFNCANLGTNTVVFTVSDASGNNASVNAVITVKDNLAPSVNAVAAQAFCNNTGGNYTIPALTATDNCSAVTITYAVTGATTRSGSGGNASGLFNTGVSTVTWTVKDASGNSITSSTTVSVSSLAPVVITPSGPDAFCNKLVLTASSAGNGATYKWTSGSTVAGTTQSISLGQSNGDGIYQVTATLNGCTSAPASYNYQKQNLISSYTLFAFDGISLGSNNTVASGSVGVSDAKGDVQIVGFNTSINSPGSFVKAKSIDKLGLNISIANPIYSPASGVTLPAMLLNTANTNGLGNKEVAQNSVVTVNGNYKNLTLHKNSRATVTGSLFGTIRVEQGAQVTFTSPTINLENLQVVKGPRNGYSYVRFSGDAKVIVSGAVTIGSQVYVNPDNNSVTFYLGDKKADDEKFTVNGGDTKVTANIYIPNGTLRVNGGYSYGSYGLFGLGDCDRDDDEPQYFGLGNSYVNMTGLFIAENVVGFGKNVIWNSFDCSSAPVPVLNNNSGVITQSTTSKEAAATTEEALKVTVMPNPSTTYFTLKLESRFETPVELRVMDGNGRVVDARSKVGANSTIQIGQSYASGTYYAELVQGNQRKVVQLIKGRG